MKVIDSDKLYEMPSGTVYSHLNFKDNEYSQFNGDIFGLCVKNTSHKGTSMGNYKAWWYVDCIGSIDTDTGIFPETLAKIVNSKESGNNITLDLDIYSKALIPDYAEKENYIVYDQQDLTQMITKMLSGFNADTKIEMFKNILNDEIQNKLAKYEKLTVKPYDANILVKSKLLNNWSIDIKVDVIKMLDSILYDCNKVEVNKNGN